MDNITKLKDFRVKRKQMEAKTTIMNADNKPARCDAIEAYFFNKALVEVEDAGKRFYQINRIATAQELYDKLIR